jgi:uncharacterized protein (TIGR03083 family)
MNTTDIHQSASSSSTVPIPAQDNVWIDVHDERHSLLLLLETLTESEWNEPSLCADWRVRDVVGHMVSETTMTLPKVVKGMVKSGFRINRFLAADACERGCRSISDLLEAYRVAVPTRTHLSGLSPLSMLEDIIIHSLDIRRPLRREHAIPARRMSSVATDLWASHFFPGHRLFRDLRVMAIDSDWSVGDGPVVTGPIESLVLVMSGRLSELAKLEGEGFARVQERVARL